MSRKQVRPATWSPWMVSTISLGAGGMVNNASSVRSATRPSMLPAWGGRCRSAAARRSSSVARARLDAPLTESSVLRP